MSTDDNIAAAVAAFKAKALHAIRRHANCATYTESVADGVHRGADVVAALPADRAALDRMLADAETVGIQKGAQDVLNTIPAYEAAARREGAEAALRRWWDQRYSNNPGYLSEAEFVAAELPRCTP